MASTSSEFVDSQLMKSEQTPMFKFSLGPKGTLTQQSLKHVMLEIMLHLMNSKNSTERHTMKDVKESPHSEQQENDMEFSMHPVYPNDPMKSPTWKVWKEPKLASLTPTQVSDPASKQVGGTHYQDMSISPSEYITKNNIPWYEGNAIKYISRHKAKGEKQDLLKAIHYLELAIKEHYE